MYAFGEMSQLAGKMNTIKFHQGMQKALHQFFTGTNVKSKTPLLAGVLFGLVPFSLASFHVCSSCSGVSLEA